MFTREDTKAIMGIAICLMLYHHLFAFPDRIADGLSYSPLLAIGDGSAYLIGRVGKICVALFMFLGGYGTYLGLRKIQQSAQDGTYGSLHAEARFIWTKLAGLYRAYWRIFAIAVPVSIALGVQRVDPSLKSLVSNFTAWSTSYNGEWWFIRPYIVLMVVYPLIHRFVDRKGGNPFVDMLLLALFQCFVYDALPALLESAQLSAFASSTLWKLLYQAAQWAPCFAAGSVFARWGILDAAKARYGGNHLRCLLALAISLAVFLARHALGNNVRYDLVLVSLFVAAFSIAATTGIGKLARTAFAAVGQKSTGIWLVHSFWCYHWAQPLVYAPHYSLLCFLLLLALSYATAMAVDAIFNAAEAGLQKISPRFDIREKDADTPRQSTP